MPREMSEAVLPGVWYGVAADAYHAHPGLSHSEAKRLRRATPYHLAMDRALGAPRREPSPAMVNGTLVHCALLEPDAFPKRYAAGPDVDKRTKEWREFAAGCAREGLTPITEEQRNAAMAQAQALHQLPDVCALLAAGQAEVSAWWTDKETGLLCKCRPDWVHSIAPPGSGVLLLDVKTASDASPRGFGKAAAEFGYATQAAWYCEGYAAASGVEVHGMVFAAVESSYPYAAAAYMFTDADSDRARAMNRDARALYARCKASGEWPGYPAGINTINLPAWAE